jgi:cytochrome c553
MTMTRLLLLFAAVLGSAVALAGNPAFAGELMAGKAKVEAACQVCHGVDGKATVAMAANLSGQQKEYIIAQLEAYRAGKRQHPQMNIIAKMLSDDDIENVAEWYSSIKVTLEMPN